MVLIRFLLSLYRKLTVYRLPTCRYYPSCSHYAEEAIEVHGLLNGSFLALRRLIRCNQLFPGGFDPVPRVK
jgi:putative membrane protein insertion efficiency factor